jgi:hypothetical protein
MADNRIKWVCWVEPLSDGAEPTFCYSKASDVVASERRRHKDHPLTATLSDEAILDSFLAVHWAEIKELPENGPT